MSNIIEFLKSSFPWMTIFDFWILAIGILVIILVLAIYVYRDSNLRGGKSASWFIWTILLGGILPFLIYIVVRSPYTKMELEEEKTKEEVVELQKKYYELAIGKEVQKCPVCGEEVSADYMYCPYCFTQLKKRCPQCGKLVDKDAKICPYCGYIFEEKGVKK